MMYDHLTYNCPLHGWVEDESEALQAHKIDGQCMLCAIINSEYEITLVPVVLK